MDSHSIISGIDAEIAKLQRVRSLLVNGGNVVGVANRKAAKKASAKHAKKRVLSPEARERIGDAQRKRWATARKLNSSAPAKAAKRAAEKTAPVKATKPVTAVQETLKAESAS